MENEFLIWWTSQTDCILVDTVAFNGELPSIVDVDYLRREYASRYGRNGSGRLWVAPCFSAHKFGINDLSDAFVPYAGIVLRRTDLDAVSWLPGFITDQFAQAFRN